MERSGVVPTIQFAYRKGLGTCDALLWVSHTLQSALESGQQARNVQIDFNAAFHMVYHQGFLYNLCSVGIGGSVLSILTQFLSNRSLLVIVDGCRSKLVNVVSGVPQRSVLGQLLLLLYNSVLFSILENKLIGYADDSTQMPVVPSPGIRVTVAKSLIRDLRRVNEWCILWGMKLNESNTKTMIVSRSRTMHIELVYVSSPPCNHFRNCTEGIDDMSYLEWPSDIWFRDDLWEASSLGFQSSFSKTWYLEDVLASVPWLIACWEMLSGFVLPVLEYCSAVWCSAVDTHLKLLDRAVSGAQFLTEGYVWVWHYSSSIRGSTVYAV